MMETNDKRKLLIDAQNGNVKPLADYLRQQRQYKFDNELKKTPKVYLYLNNSLLYFAVLHEIKVNPVNIPDFVKDIKDLKPYYPPIEPHEASAKKFNEIMELVYRGYLNKAISKANEYHKSHTLKLGHK